MATLADSVPPSEDVGIPGADGGVDYLLIIGIGMANVGEAGKSPLPPFVKGRCLRASFIKGELCSSPFIKGTSLVPPFIGG